MSWCKILSPNKSPDTRDEAPLQITSPERLVQFRNLLQSELFPLLESSLGPLSKASRLLASIVSLEPLARWVDERRAATGRPARDRLSLATAFFFKAVYKLPTTSHFIQRLHADTQLRRLCGWNHPEQVPMESTFSRAFAEFAAAGLPGKVHAAIVRQTQQSTVIGHLARDSTAIEARQHLPIEHAAKPSTKPAPAPKYKTKNRPSPAPQRWPAQTRQSLSARISAAMPAAYDTNSDAGRTAARM